MRICTLGLLLSALGFFAAGTGLSQECEALVVRVVQEQLSPPGQANIEILTYASGAKWRVELRTVGKKDVTRISTFNGEKVMTYEGLSDRLFITTPEKLEIEEQPYRLIGHWLGLFSFAVPQFTEGYQSIPLYPTLTEVNDLLKFADQNPGISLTALWPKLSTVVLSAWMKDARNIAYLPVNDPATNGKQQMKVRHSESNPVVPLAVESLDSQGNVLFEVSAVPGSPTFSLGKHPIPSAISTKSYNAETHKLSWSIISKISEFRRETVKTELFDLNPSMAEVIEDETLGIAFRRNAK